MTDPLINLYSDTQTRPTPQMRAAIATAEVGDEQRGEDPTVNRLCELVAELTGKPRAVFLPTGTMCNEIAILVHCRPGDEIYADVTAHITNFEGGGPAALAGAVTRSIAGTNGIYSPEQLEASIRQPSRYSPTPRLCVVEQTSNLGGGTVWPLDTMRAVTELAHEHGLTTHMDGARLPNAVIASGSSFAEHAAGFDTVWIDLSKGLGCPVGAVLAGSEEFIDAAWQWKQRLGGALRQGGIVAAAGVYAFEHHLDRLADDHANARRFAELVADVDGLAIDLETVQTNMVFVDIAATGRNATELSAELEARGVRIGAMGPTTLRAVTHLDVTAAQIETAAATFGRVVAERAG